MLVEVNDVTLTNVWEEFFTDRETGEQVKYYRALLTAVGEPPMQIGVDKADFEGLQGAIGAVGVATIDLDAQPNRRVRVRLRGMD